MVEPVSLDWHAKGAVLAPHWRSCIGAGRAAEALRADFQAHLEMVQREMPFSYLRCHGIFHDDMMVYHEEDGRPILNWQYVDKVYDHWLSVGLRPFVELGFMPHDLASGDETVFWWKGNITPPRDWSRWEWLVGQFLEHLMDRFGASEVRQWYFEVWNEPNLPMFWKSADFAAYMELYEHTAASIKRIDPALRVGGPASSGSGDRSGQAPWGTEFLAACRQRAVPIDFFSTHPYPTIHTVDIAGTGQMTWDEPDRLLTDLKGVAEMLAATGFGGLARHFTEWCNSPSPRDLSHDTAFMAPFIVRNNWLARGMADSLTFWALTDIFEETRLGEGPFHGGFGLVNTQGLKKPAYHGYWFLSRLGGVELASGDGFAATRRQDGTRAVLMWNYCHYRQATPLLSGLAASRRGRSPYDLFAAGGAKTFQLEMSGLEDLVRIDSTRFDREHGSVYDAWADMGEPENLSPADVTKLREFTEPQVASEVVRTVDGRLRRDVVVQPHGVTLLELRGSSRDV